MDRSKSGKPNISKKIICQFVAEVEFGVLSNNCNNYGICSIAQVSPHKKLRPEKDRGAIGVISISDQNEVEIDFFKTTIRDQTYLWFFSRDKFLVQEDFLFKAKDNDLVDFKIKRGIYQIMEGSSFIKVKFDEVI